MKRLTRRMLGIIGLGGAASVVTPAVAKPATLTMPPSYEVLLCHRIPASHSIKLNENDAKGTWALYHNFVTGERICYNNRWYQVTKSGTYETARCV